MMPFINYSHLRLRLASTLASRLAMTQLATVRVPGHSEIKVPTGLFINNEFVPSVDSKEMIDAVNPFTEEVICSVSSASEKDIDIAVAAARKAFNTTWGKNVTGWERSRLINKLADLIETHAQELGELESLNNGKPLRIARDFDIGDSVQCLRYYAGWADKIAGQTLEVDNKTKFAFTKHEPIGVCGQIIPWNYPINMWSWKVAPALAVGCTIVMKPSELTPLTALKLSELVKEAGFPPGVLNTVPSLGPVGGAALSAHPDVDKIAFTGSTITGRKIMEAAAKSNLKKVSLELGGKSPHLIFESCDMDQAAIWAAAGITYNSGQDCTAGSRVYVQDSIHDKFVELLVSKVKELVVGNGLDDKTSAGPVVSKTQYDRVWSYIESGKQEGAKVVVGGTKRTGKGFFVDPTIFTDIRPDMKIVKEEASLCMLETRILFLRDSRRYLAPSFQLAGSKLRRKPYCWRMQPATAWAPVSIPGIGRELGSYALEEYTSVKAVHWNFGEKLDWPL
ncbi:Aldehyde dehydrogenase [Mycena venus]|uniref:Aldehyde dehydrogenase n=1 Tax=Mycena venus TaxID=2733690 RepID=A0A8H6Y6R9_9AGAR|nr:Aldehyde dehydrogenase [Mycena venus]